MSAITTWTGRWPVSGASATVMLRGQVRRRNSPPGPDLHRHPAVPDHHANDLAAGQVGSDLTKRPAVQRGHPHRARDGLGDGVDVDAVDHRKPGHAVVLQEGHDTLEDALS